MSLNTADSRWGCRWFWLGAGLLAIFIAFALDNVVDGWLSLPGRESAWRVAGMISKYGEWLPTLLAGLIAVATIALLRKFTVARLLLLILAAGLLTGLASTIIRSTVGRTRPAATDPQGFYGLRHQGKWMFGRSEFGSFPSGHTAVWAGLAGAAWFRRRWLAVIFLSAAAVMAWARIAVGYHHFSDVTASIVWGLLVGPWVADRLENGVNRCWFKLGLPV